MERNEYYIVAATLLLNDEVNHSSITIVCCVSIWSHVFEQLVNMWTADAVANGPRDNVRIIWQIEINLSSRTEHTLIYCKTSTFVVVVGHASRSCSCVVMIMISDQNKYRLINEHVMCNLVVNTELDTRPTLLLEFNYSFFNFSLRITDFPIREARPVFLGILSIFTWKAANRRSKSTWLFWVSNDVVFIRLKLIFYSLPNNQSGPRARERYIRRRIFIRFPLLQSLWDRHPIWTS